MPELKIICTNLDLVKNLFQNAVENELNLVLSGIKKTEVKLTYFENKYKILTREFLQRYENDEIDENLEMDEWIGEALMLESLYQDLEQLRGIKFVN